MKIFLDHDVFTAALDRIRWLMDEFDDYCVFSSGGKDSTVTLELVTIVAREKNRLPVPVIFIDQEAEWSFTIDHIKEIMSRPEVKPLWYQTELNISNNATNQGEKNLNCWAKGGEWMREKDPAAIHEADFKTNNFKDRFPQILEANFTGSVAGFGGVRCEESPARTVGLTEGITYQHVTYGKHQNKAKSQYAFYPIYDWSYRDIWKAICDNDWKYCKLYDYMYQHGIPFRDMRVSNLNHETALRNLFFLQEVDRETWNKLVKRLPGINTAGHLKDDAISAPKKLPWMFSGWIEYRDYLAAILPSSESSEAFRLLFETNDKRYEGMQCLHVLHRVQCNAIIRNDVYYAGQGSKTRPFSTLVSNFEARPEVGAWRKWKRTGLGAFPTNRFVYGKKTKDEIRKTK